MLESLLNTEKLTDSGIKDLRTSLRRFGEIANSNKGVSGTGQLLGKFTNRKAKEYVLLEPGDYVRKSELGGDTVITTPIAYDVWYLFNDMNFISLCTIEGGEDSEWPPKKNADLVVSTQLKFLSEKLEGVKPLRALQKLDDLISNPEFTFYGTKKVADNWENNGIAFIQIMPFEMWLYRLGAEVSSDGPGHGFEVNDHVGYLTFPMGQLGAMEVISILRESKTDAVDFEIDDEEKPVTQDPGEMFPPRLDSKGNIIVGNNKCFGRHLIESAYVPPDSERQKLEYPATHIPEKIKTFDEDGNQINAAGYKNVLPKGWMRYWIHKDDTMPVPGEFIGILCKPLAIPPHLWWFQQTTPLLYAGNWVETKYLTSGIVTKVTLEKDRTDGGIGNQYEVRVQGYEITLDASDFFEYAVNDRVGIIKIDNVRIAQKEDKTTKTTTAHNVTERGPLGSFKWVDQVMFNELYWFRKYTEYVILPIEFYQEEE